MEKPRRKLYVASLAPQDFDLLESERRAACRTRGEYLALVVRKLREVESERDSRDEVTHADVRS
jgi:hypothetical protein